MVSIILGVCVNLIYNIFMGLVEDTEYQDNKIPARHSIIPGTKQKFLHIQDFYTMTWGDYVAVSVINAIFVFQLMAGKISWLDWVIIGVVGIIDAYLFAKMCLAPTHKPDWGYPEVGKISLGGVSHLIYHGYCIGISVVLVISMITGKLQGAPMWTALIGGAIYVAAFIADIKSKNFDPIKRVS